MKKYFFFLLFLSCVPFLYAQSIDSLTIQNVDSLIKISRDFTAKKDFEKAVEVNAEAEKIALDKLGRESAVYGSCCFNHGRVMYYKGDYHEAENWYLESIMIREKALGKEHLDYASSLNNLATLYYIMGQYEKAEPLFLEAKAIRKKVLGREHLAIAKSLNNLAVLYKAMGRYEKAEPLHIETMTIRKKALGVKHPDYARSLNNLGDLYNVMGRYEKAQQLYIEAMAIREETLGKEHPHYASSLNSLSVLYKNMGHYKKAEPLCIEVKAIREKTLGKEHLEYASSLNNLGDLYHDMGQDEKAESLYIEAMAIKEKALGKEHPLYANTLNNLGILYKGMGQDEKAELLYIEAMAIREKALGKEHPLYASSLNNLAILYKDMGRYEKAQQLYIEAMAIRNKVLGKEHPDYAMNLNNFAILYKAMGQYEKAQSLYIEASAIQEKTLGREHPHYAMSLNNQALLYSEMGHYEKAEPFYRELSEVNQRLIQKALLHLSENELNEYLRKLSNRQDLILSFTQSVASNQLIPTCYNNSLFYKGFMLQAAGRIKQLALRDSIATETFNHLKGYQRRLATMYAKPIAERDSALVAQLEAQANDLEKDLTRTVAGYREAKRQVTWQEVQAALNPNEAAVEFVNYRFYKPPNATDSTMYAALVLRPGVEAPVFIPLFEEKELDHLLDDHKAHKADYVNNLYEWTERGLVRMDLEKKNLLDLIWSKIEAMGLEGINTVYYSPSGLLHRINLGAIALDERTVLSDRYNLIELNSTRQLAVPDKADRYTRDAILVGGVEFDLAPEHASTVNELASRSIHTAWAESERYNGTWSPLIWTLNEVESISTTLSSHDFQPTLYTGTEATEEAVKAICSKASSPRILHVATHGFFFPDPKARDGNPGLEEAESVFKAADNPMVRSGLILAGGNHAWQNGRAVNSYREDGILTAYEISQMNLSNTELVILSACETGLGDIKGNEGVYGLQRAFKIAGAKYIIMSLWQIPDRETMQFMTTFYRNWLEKNLTIPVAFRKTQLEMRDRFFNPYAWAGFVLVE